MRLLVLGSTGLLGQALCREAAERGWEVAGAARRDAPIKVDIAENGAVASLLQTASPDLVINAAGLIDVAACERDPDLAERVNADPARAIAKWSAGSGTPFIQISTDHFYTRGKDRPHREDEPVEMVNEYARTKRLAEQHALKASNGLVARTSIVGKRGWTSPTLAEWAVNAVLEDAPVTLFDDAFTSSIDTPNLARALFDLAEGGAAGLFNVAASQVYSKANFVLEIARQLGRNLTNADIGSVRDLEPTRATDLGLDVSRAEWHLGRKLPDLQQVVASVLSEFKESGRG